MITRAFSSILNYPLLFAAGVILLAIHPITWLVGTWIDPAYDSHGFLIIGLVAGLFIWSLSSPQIHQFNVGRRHALVLFALTAGVRLLGQLLGVNVIGAVALALDVYALGLLLNVNQRQRALAPGWLAVLFAFSLPLERIIQRTIGFGLQQLSAAGACQILNLGSASVRCEGVRTLLAGQDVLVDLPCAGARNLLLLLLLFAALASLIRPPLLSALIGLGITVVTAVITNLLRIVTLALGLAYPSYFGGISVMEAPWHEGIGILTLALGAIVLLSWTGVVPVRSVYPIAPPTKDQFDPSSLPYRTSNWHHQLLGLGFVAFAAFIVSLPAHPVDVARRLEPITLPATIASLPALRGGLSAQERDYFTRYGGSAARASYGPYGLLVVSTSAPLRHLHAPDECLAGRGHQVRYLGIDYQHLPTTLYRSLDPEGHAWRVAVTFVSDRGELATSVAEAVWRWLQDAGSTWTMVQRIAPWDMPEDHYAFWDAAVARALDIPHTATRRSFQQSPQEILR